MIIRHLLLCIMGIMACTHLFGDNSYTLKKISADTYELTSQDSLIGHIVYEEKRRISYGSKLDKYAFLDSDGVPTLFGQSHYTNSFPLLKFSLSECDYFSNPNDLIDGKIWKVRPEYDDRLRITNVIGCSDVVIAITSSITNEDILTLTRSNGDTLVQIIKNPDSECWDIVISDDNIIPLEVISIFGAFLDQTYLYWKNMSPSKNSG